MSSAAIGKRPDWHVLTRRRGFLPARSIARGPEQRRSRATVGDLRRERTAGSGAGLPLVVAAGAIQERPDHHPACGDGAVCVPGPCRGSHHDRRDRDVCRDSGVHPGVSCGACHPGASPHGGAVGVRAAGRPRVRNPGPRFGARRCDSAACRRPSAGGRAAGRSRQSQDRRSRADGRVGGGRETDRSVDGP